MYPRGNWPPTSGAGAGSDGGAAADRSRHKRHDGVWTSLGSGVLVLNRVYLPVHVTTVRRAFSLVYQGSARAVDRTYRTFDFEAWMDLDHATAEDAIGTSRGRIGVPRVIVLSHYDRMPRRHIRFSRGNVFSRDHFTCQYCGGRPGRVGLNLDHVVPRSQGGRTTWENVVASCVPCNRRKGGRTPEQAGYRLDRRPARPRWSPFLSVSPSSARYHDWRPFLHEGQFSTGEAAF